jgi:hypothetical protein
MSFRHLGKPLDGDASGLSRAGGEPGIDSSASTDDASGWNC